jgi:hypothetical protein
MKQNTRRLLRAAVKYATQDDVSSAYGLIKIAADYESGKNLKDAIQRNIAPSGVKTAAFTCAAIVSVPSVVLLKQAPAKKAADEKTLKKRAAVLEILNRKRAAGENIADTFIAKGNEAMKYLSENRELVLPAVGGLGGAGLGYLMTDDEKKRFRNALVGALGGTVAGAGTAYGTRVGDVFLDANERAKQYMKQYMKQPTM